MATSTKETADYLDLNLHGDSKESNILNTPLELFFQEIELAMKTAPNEIWGIGEGINLSRYVFNKFVTLTQIRNEITNFIGKYCEHANVFQYNITAETITTDKKDMVYITMTVDSEQEQYKQKFLLGA